MTHTKLNSDMRATCFTEEQILKIRLIEQTMIEMGCPGVRREMDALMKLLTIRHNLEANAELQAKLAMIPTEDTSKVMTTPLRELNLSTRAENALLAERLTTIGLVMTRTEKQLLGIRGISVHYMHTIKKKLAERGLRLRS